MNSITTMMTADHRTCDTAFVAFEAAVDARDWGAADQTFATLRATTLRHFRSEEEVLFPAFERATGSDQGPTAVMRMEHGQLRGLLDQLEDAITARDHRRALALCESFMVLIQQHNMKEEQILYPMSDQALSAIPDLLEQLRATAS